MIEVKKAIIKYFQENDNITFSLDQIQTASGSSEIISQILFAFGGIEPNGFQRKILLPSTHYAGYDGAAAKSMTQVVLFQLTDDFFICPKRAIEAIEKEKPHLIFLTNPNNPTGNFNELSVIEEILIATQKIHPNDDPNAKPILAVDEAYIDFVDHENASAINLINKYDNLIVLRTLSKSFRFAGLRFGFALANAEIITALKVIRGAYDVGFASQSLAKTALENHRRMKSPVKGTIERRNELEQWLKTLSYQDKPLIITPSGANFIQVGFDPSIPNYLELPQKVIDFLLEQKIIVRLVGAPGFFRVSIGTKDELDRFKEEFPKFLAQSN